MLRLFLPLALSSLLMGLSSLVIAASVARLPEPATMLAAMGVVSGLAILVESPIIAILSTSIALSENREAARLVWRFMVGIGVGLTGINLLAFFTPLYGLLAGTLLGLPAPVAEAAGPALQLMVLWPLSIGWRRYYQALIIRQGQTAIIGWGTVLRLATVGLLAYLVGPALGWPGATIGALAMVGGALAEAAMMTPAGLLAERRLPPRPSGEPALTLSETWRYHRPLAATNAMRVVIQPLISMALARAALPTLSLAAWPLVSGTALLLASATVPLQEVAIAAQASQADPRRLSVFAGRVGLVLTGLLTLVVATPLLDGYLGVVLGAPADVRTAATLPLLLLLPVPLLLAAQSLLRGLLARQRQTGSVGRAMLVNLAVLAGWLSLWVGLNLGPGVIGASLAYLIATGVECVILLRYLRSSLSARRENPPNR